MRTYQWLGAAVLAGAIALAGCSKAAKEAAKEVLDPAKYGVGKDAKICPVSKEEIGKMGDPAEITLSNGKKMIVCCPACKKAVEKDLDHYAAFMY